ncbi:MAG: hypothetical protein EZS28_027556 [Streblomastix strix]|uniref:Protein kinase domain-containing protein n=1 Tax=Streblomastix strix TaxID=222440 RepID=A0A5J4V2R1_9EUKA|nr:MAG: hypothetical protein EZS28_027556 [Streblomastix strix]
MTVDKLQAGVHLNPICIGETVGQIYVVERILAAGKSSTVYIARAGQELVALKVVPIQNGNSNLDIDIAVLKSIGGRDHFLKMFGFGSHRQYRFIAMQLLGPTLNDIMKRPLMQKLCLSSVAKIGIQGLEALSTLHIAGFIHGKVSMENLMIGYNKEASGKIYLTDFSQSHKIDGNQINSNNKAEKRLSSGSSTENFGMKSKIKLIQNDLYCLLKMLMALYSGVEEV